MTLGDIPTPALLLDLDLLESNIQRMAAHVKAAGKNLRPHAKAHKCVEIARRQVAAGAIGICVATVAEAECMVRAGVHGVLLTSPIADPNKARRMAQLSAIDPTIMAAVDHPEQAATYQAAAKQAGVKLNILVDIDPGDHRTGIQAGKPAVDLVHAVRNSPDLVFKGLQSYAGSAAHVEGWGNRSEYSLAHWQPAIETRGQLLAEGVEIPIMSGGSTGTHNIDTGLSPFTELQAGSYPMMDVDYARIGGLEFAHALTVLATVVSANHAGRVTLDSGFKSMATDRPFGPEALGIPGVHYEFAGDEFGYLHIAEGGQEIPLGTRIRLIPPHCDPTVNLYDRFYCHRSEQVEAVWPIMDRIRAEQSAAIS
jgi:D-serine deaminase-like pyridoxal phosphate-dependent protein